ncbi:beta-ketoacyl synthase N-terminal-like domain-containing protein, partial [Methylocucumis oryzae]|uniref:beta-ketoacyl synthase N-terminal-like domain-containing protein n=1 Tax=Methylocucumis oryzae TaxID=1632867 RepID=UPI0012FEB1E4
DLTALGLEADVFNRQGFVPLKYSLTGKELFDAEFFNISPKNAELMDPQYRLLLELAWSALEDAGLTPEQVPNTAVFMAAGNNAYKHLLLASGTATGDDYAAWLATQAGSIAGMISYQLGFTGPSVAVHSNCSSSLSGLYLAMQCLKRR